MQQHNSRGDYPGGGSGVGLIAVKLVSANTHIIAGGANNAVIITWDLDTDVEHDFGFNVELAGGDSRKIACPRIGWYRFSAWVQFPASNTFGANLRVVLINVQDASGTPISRSCRDDYQVYSNTQVYEACVYGEYYMEDTDWHWTLQAQGESATGMTIPVGATMWINYINTR